MMKKIQLPALQELQSSDKRYMDIKITNKNPPDALQTGTTACL